MLTTVLDTYKGGSHMPLLSACDDIEFTVVTNRVKAAEGTLPSNVYVVTLNARIGSYYYGFADMLFARSVLRAHPSEDAFWKQFDAIHINQVMGPALRKLKKTGVPLIFMIHHPVTADRDVAVAESGWFDGLIWRLKYALLIRWQREMARAADRVVTVSKTMRERIAHDYGCSPEKITVVENGVDGVVFTPAADADCTFDVIAVGSFVHPRKGFRYLANTYRALAASGKRIADVGRRSDSQMKELLAIPGVTVHGSVDQDTLVRLIRHSRVLVSTSLFEGFGLSLIEALSSGHPAFAFAVGAVPEVLGGIDQELLIPPRDTGAMIDAIASFLRHSPKEREERGALYRTTVLKRYSLSASAESLRLAYAKSSA